MKHLLLTLFVSLGLFFFFSIELTAQSDDYLFSIDATYNPLEKQAFFAKSKLERATLLRIDDGIFDKIKREKSQELVFMIPQEDGSAWKLTLTSQAIYTEDFRLVATDGITETIMPVDKGLHYRGMVNGDPHSLAGFSFFESGIMGVFSYQGKSYNIEKTKTKQSQRQYILYRQEDLKTPLSFECHTSDDEEQLPPLPPNFSPNSNPHPYKESNNKSAGATVEVYIECDYIMYQDNGNSVENTQNFTTGLFNVVAGLYANAGGAGMGPTMMISEIVVWTSQDPYGIANASSSLPVLNAFRDALPSYNGRLAHLLSTTNRNLGGIANRPSCPEQGTYYSALHGFSNIDNDYNDNLNVYSWSVEVLAHELGHNMSSPHTHACAWNGNETQIDDCGNKRASDRGNTVEGADCYNNGNPKIPMEGTIMSYCHLIDGVGINLAAGFHPQVAAKINSFAEECLTSDIPCPTAAVSELSASNITNNSARLNCSKTEGISRYYFSYRKEGKDTWIEPGTVTTNYVDIGSLDEGSNYSFDVAIYCIEANLWSPYSGTATFTTGSGECPSNVNFSTGTIASGTYISSDTITASATIEGGSEVYFSAPEVYLYPNFGVNIQGILHIYMEGCTTGIPE